MISHSLLLALALGAPPDPGAVDYFETKVRPLLADHCFRCHGEKKQQAGLRLDTAEGMRKGTDAGPVVVPGNPDQSKLVKSVQRQGDFPMPPDKPLPAEAAAILAAWVKAGAVFPTANSGQTQIDPLAAGKNHWAFQPPTEPPVPAVKAALQSNNPIDRFVQSKLEAKGLTLSREADKRSLIRRAYFDLVGLPPTAAEIEAFEKDESPTAFERVVDKLLASPHYGERWGRHWLDLARYADSKGYVFTEERTYPYAYTYRDYVIRSLNEDKPYNQFVIEQLAADKLPLGEDKRPLAALGFLTLGRRFSNNTHDIIDDRIDVTTRGLLGLTVACARCHDHKYDPIPAADYYSLYGVFASTVEPKDLPLISKERTKETELFEAELAKREQALTDLKAKRHADIIAELRSKDGISKYLLAVAQSEGAGRESVQASIQNGNLRRAAFDRWKDYLTAAAKKASPVFDVWFAVQKLPEAGFAEAFAKRITETKSPINPRLKEALVSGKPKTIAEVAAIYGAVLSKAWPPPKGDIEPDHAELLAAVGNGGAVDVPATDGLFNRADRDKFTEAQKKIDQYKATSPFAPPRAMAVADSPAPTNPYVFLRGNPGNRGPNVPRQFIAAVSGPNRKPFAEGSGRLELARAIASPENPLTARVFVNRVWEHLIGKPLVLTPSDFGIRTEKPVHAELLDWLAKRFVDDGWSIKKLHKRILLSATYRQVSDTPMSLAAADPENRLISRMNRKRADFETLRDSLLFVAGKLDETVYGRSVDLFAKPAPTRRSVYAFIDRQNLPSTLRAFDFASPEQHTPQRFTTTVPQQALYLMNSPFVTDQARGVANRPEVLWAFAPAERIRRIYRAVLARNPSAAETQLALEFTANAPPPTGTQLNRWELLAQVLLCSNEFAFVD